MRRSMYAVLDRGTARSETALCEEHNTDLDRTALSQRLSEDMETAHFADCTGNTELQCQVCGYTPYPRYKRVVATLNVPYDMSDNDVAMTIDAALPNDTDTTVWEWGLFWLDHETGQVGPEGDSTSLHQLRRGDVESGDPEAHETMYVEAT